MKKCWAASLGDCSDKMSGEHIVSAGIFPGNTVNIKGLSWRLDAPKQIGLANLVKNVLCTEHNSRLSPVDEAGIQTFKTISAFIGLGHVRSGVARKAVFAVRQGLRFCTMLRAKNDQPMHSHRAGWARSANAQDD
jgi:hypothetical protein